jgi:hypothetical protein
MLSRRALSFVLAFSLVAVFALSGVPAARADAVMNFDSVVSSCNSGIYTVSVSTPTSSALGLPIAPLNARVEVWDSDSTLLGENAFGASFGGTYSGTIAYSHTAKGPVTFYLYYSFNVAAPAQPVQVKEVLADVEVTDANCISLPGCDVLISLPSTAVVGQFTAPAAAYWEPGQLITNPPVTIEPGKTYYVIGQDASQQYYKVLLGCTFVWVQKSTVGPDFDAVWHGTPLPTTIVN